MSVLRRLIAPFLPAPLEQPPAPDLEEVPESVRRARSLVGQGRYCLGAGPRGADALFGPCAHPDNRRHADHKGKVFADCSKFATYCLGLPRFDPAFPEYGGWLNTDSMIAEARRTAQWFAIVEHPQPGDLLVYPGIDLDGDGTRDRIGHIAVVDTVPPLWDGDLADLVVIHCAASGTVAVRKSDATIWKGRDVFRGRRNPKWGSVFLRSLKSTRPAQEVRGG